MKRTTIVMGLALAGCGLLVLAQNPQTVPAAAAISPETAADMKTALALAAEAATPIQVRVQVEFIELSHEALTKLLFPATPQSADATPLRKQLQEMVAKNDAKVLDTQMLVVRSGQKATTESIHEFIYPTEYEPPSLPGTFTSGSGKDKSLPSSCMPTAFETRNLGSTLEIEPTVGEDHKIIDLRLVPELVWHTGDTVWGEGKDAFGIPFKISMPDIYTMRLNTAIFCITGQYILVGAVSPKDAKGEVDLTRKVMVFVKCDVLAGK